MRMCDDPFVVEPCDKPSTEAPCDNLSVTEPCDHLSVKESCGFWLLRVCEQPEEAFVEGFGCLQPQTGTNALAHAPAHLGRDTFIKADAGESPNDRNDRAIRVATKWCGISRMVPFVPLLDLAATHHMPHCGVIIWPGSWSSKLTYCGACVCGPCLLSLSTPLQGLGCRAPWRTADCAAVREGWHGRPYLVRSISCPHCMAARRATFHVSPSHPCCPSSHAIPPWLYHGPPSTSPDHLHLHSSLSHLWISLWFRPHPWPQRAPHPPLHISHPPWPPALQ